MIQRLRRMLGSRRRAKSGLVIALCLNAAIGEAAAPVIYADVAGIFEQHCIVCHSGTTAPLSLRLDSLDGTLAGSSNGPVVEAGRPESSELIRRVSGASQPRMPMTGPPFLSEADMRLLEQWVRDGMQAGPEPVGAVSRHDGGSPTPDPDGPVTYAQVAPIFARRCAKCHAARGQMGPAPEGYVLTGYAATLDSADRVRVVPGRPRASEIVRRIRGDALPRMPFDGPPYLEPAEIRMIERWVADGAQDVLGRPAAFPVGAKVRLHGRLQSRWVLDGLQLDVGKNTRIDKAPDAGDYVQVRGRLRRDGGIEVERIRKR